MRVILVNVLAILISVTVFVEKSGAQQQSAAAPANFKMASVYYDEDWIPFQYTCGAGGDAGSPAVQWSESRGFIESDGRSRDRKASLVGIFGQKVDEKAWPWPAANSH